MAQAAFPIDVQTAAYRHFVGSDEFAELVANEWLGEDESGTPWVFQGLDSEGRPFRHPEGSGKAVIVIMSRTDWAGANAHNTASFPRLQVLIYADSSRDADGSVTAPDASHRLKAIFEKVDRVFHSVRTKGMSWSGYRAHSSLRTGSLDIQDVPETQSYVVRGEANYEIVSD